MAREGQPITNYFDPVVTWWDGTSGVFILTLFLVGVLLVQQFRISLIRESSTRPWRDVTKTYRTHLRIGSIVFLLYVSGCLLLLPQIEADSLDTRKDEQLNNALFGSSEIVALFVVGVLSASIRLVLDRAVDEPKSIVRFFSNLIRSFRGAPLSTGKSEALHEDRDTWLWWFSATTLFGVVLSFSWVRDTIVQPLTDKPPNWLMGIGVFLVGLTYFVWLYDSVYRKLTRVHHVSGLGARSFAGNLYGGNGIPIQMVIVGPTGSGKTVLAKGRKPLGNEERTQDVVTDTWNQSINVSDEERYHYEVSCIDTPGENMGDHLSVIASYRTDVLVLVIDGLALSPTRLKSDKKMVYTDFHSFFKDRAHALYFQALRLATQRANIAEAGSINTFFRVRSIVMFINVYGDEQKASAVTAAIEPRMKHFNSVLKVLGELLEVAPENCTAIVGSILDGGREKVLKCELGLSVTKKPRRKRLSKAQKLSTRRRGKNV